MRDYRQEFSDFSPLVYLDCAYQGAFPKVTEADIDRLLEIARPA